MMEEAVQRLWLLATGVEYGSRVRGNMSEFSQRRLSDKGGETEGEHNASPEAFEQNVQPTHIQTVIWKSVARSNPPAMDPTKFGREGDKLFVWFHG